MSHTSRSWISFSKLRYKTKRKVIMLTKASTSFHSLWSNRFDLRRNRILPPMPQTNKYFLFFFLKIRFLFPWSEIVEIWERLPIKNHCIDLLLLLKGSDEQQSVRTSEAFICRSETGAGLFITKWKEIINFVSGISRLLSVSPLPMSSVTTASTTGGCTNRTSSGSGPVLLFGHESIKMKMARWNFTATSNGPRR